VGVGGCEGGCETSFLVMLGLMGLISEFTACIALVRIAAGTSLGVNKHGQRH